MLLRNRAMLFAIGTVLVDLGLSAAATAQEKEATPDEATTQPARLTVGDPAPPVQVEKFLKGDAVEAFKPGHSYVIEFWSTWCGPCRAGMPHLTELQKKFKDKVTFVSVNIWEDKEYSEKTLAKVQEFVKKNDEKMGYTVAYDGAAKKMDTAYMKAANENGIPTAFIVTTDGKIGYIGHPQNPRFEETLQQLVDGTFDIAKAIAACKEEQERQAAWEKAYGQYVALMTEARALVEAGKIDEGLAKIDEAGKLLPDADPAGVDMQKFHVLIYAKEYDQAYAIAARLVAGPFNDNASALNSIAWSIVDPEAAIMKPDLPLAFKAAERAVELTESKDASIVDTLARCYWLKGDKAKAIELQTQAVALCEDNPAMKESLQKTLDEYKQLQ
ncbi:MAG: redoxin family protein [Phycisphaerae bacterium]|jgi:thiol-disulfide isomerase/thioredoxin